MHCGGVGYTHALVNSSCVSCVSKHKAKLKSARERRAKVSVTTVSGSIDYNTRPPSGTNLTTQAAQAVRNEQRRSLI